MAQKTRKQYKKNIDLGKLTRPQKLELNEKMRKFRENARNELATNLTLTDAQKLNLVVDYIVGVPLEE